MALILYNLLYNIQSTLDEDMYFNKISLVLIKNVC